MSWLIPLLQLHFWSFGKDAEPVPMEPYRDRTIVHGGTCPRCKGPRIEIDRFGERLIGCVVCNLWTWPESLSVSMALPEHDLEALRKRVGH